MNKETYEKIKKWAIKPNKELQERMLASVRRQMIIKKLEKLEKVTFDKSCDLYGDEDL